MSRLRELLEILARGLADEPQQVRVLETERGASTLVEIYAAPRDVGKMIGRQGRTIAAMRTLLGVTAERDRRQATLEVRDGPAPD